MSKQTFAELAEDFSANVFSVDIIRPLAEQLGVSTDALMRLGIGINPLNGSYTFPERDHTGKTIGILQRFPDGKKIAIQGSKRGLIYEVNTERKRFSEEECGWERVNKQFPCRLCGKPDGCLYPTGCYDDPTAIVCVQASIRFPTESTRKLFVDS